MLHRFDLLQLTLLWLPWRQLVSWFDFTIATLLIKITKTFKAHAAKIMGSTFLQVYRCHTSRWWVSKFLLPSDHVTFCSFHITVWWQKTLHYSEPLFIFTAQTVSKSERVFFFLVSSLRFPQLPTLNRINKVRVKQLFLIQPIIVQSLTEARLSL